MSTTRPRRLLIVTGNLSLLRGHYDPVIAELAREGVEVSIRFFKETQLVPDEYAAALAAAAGTAIPVQRVPKEKPRPADRLPLRLRQLGNTLRYTHPDYEGRTVLSERSLEKIDPGVRRWSRRIRRLDARLAARVATAAARIEAELPASTAARELLALEKPDAVAVVPVIRQPKLVEYLKAGSESGISTAIWVQSWDNLTNKGLLHFVPDRVFVWNRSQERELARYHGVPASHVCMTGAQTFDHWFEDAVIPTRSDFCAAIGVDPERPIILYLASSRQIAPDEPAFFQRWLDAVRASDDPELRTATVLVRPHPTLVDAWHSHHFDREPSVAVSPSLLESKMNSREFRERYRAELHHASVAVGINTSGFIDAAIFGKPSCTVELPELFHGQRGTVHFELLARPDGGLLRVASTLDAHLLELCDLIRRDAYAHDERSRSFVADFVRPHGLEVSPTSVFVREMLSLCAKEAGASRRPGGLGRLVARTAWLVGAPLEAAPVESIRKELALCSSRARRTVSRSIAYRAARRLGSAARRLAARRGGRAG